MLQTHLRIFFSEHLWSTACNDCLHQRLATISKFITYQCKNWYFFFQDVDDIQEIHKKQRDASQPSNNTYDQVNSWPVCFKIFEIFGISDFCVVSCSQWKWKQQQKLNKRNKIHTTK